MENIEIENRNEFKVDANTIVSDAERYLSIIRSIAKRNTYIDNVGTIYFDKILEIEKIYQDKNLSYFELQDNFLNKIIYSYLHNCTIVAISLLKSIVKMADKLYNIPIINKLFYLYLDMFLNEYDYICNIIANFSIEKDLETALISYIEFNKKFGDSQIFVDDFRKLSTQLSDLGIENNFFTIEKVESKKSKKLRYKLRYNLQK